MELLDGATCASAGAAVARRLRAAARRRSSLALLHSRRLVHRDVSPRNVRCTADGRAKLIDFGAMVPMGVAKDVVGTPPFVAPEVAAAAGARRARRSVSALGALGYYMLTGRHAYPARRMAELRDVWRSTPPPPIRFASKVPAALSVLIMQLIALDRGTRPESAAEVMKRLCAKIGGLHDDDQAAVLRAYLIAPALVGRDAADFCSY